MPDIPAADRALFNGGPPHQLQSWVAGIRDGRPHLLRRMLVGVAIMWLPLLVLSAVHGELVGRGMRIPFLLDFGAQARFLLVPPLLMYAEYFCLPRLGAMAAQFVEAGLVRSGDYPRYQQAVTATRRLMNSRRAEALALALSYALATLLLLFDPGKVLPAWHGVRTAGGFAFFPAGWWAALVSLPLLILLELGWAWRLGVWTRFLWLMNRLDLRLVAAHPDHAGGLRFLGYSLRAFLPLGLVLGVVVAGPILNWVVHQNAAPLQFKFVIAGTAALAVIVVAGPLLVFVPRLIETQRHGMYTYGTLAVRMGERFEDKWLDLQTGVGKEALSASDFSATTDLYSIVSNVYAMRVVPLELKNLLLLVGVTLLPFVPIALLSEPLDVILEKLAGLFI